MRSLAVIQLRTDVAQPGAVDAVRLSADGFDQFFGFELFKHRERAVAEQQPFAGKALDVGDAAGSVADVNDTSAFSEDVQGTLFLSGNIHTGNACNHHVQKRANTCGCSRKGLSAAITSPARVGRKADYLMIAFSSIKPLNE